MYITIGKNKKHYEPDEWQFTVYQVLNIHINDPNMIGKPFCITNNETKYLVDTYKGKKLNYWQLPYGDRIKPTAGKIIIGYNTSTDIIKQEVIIEPSILSVKELQDMAKMIGDVIFNCHSFTYANFEQAVNQGTDNGGDIIGANLQKKVGYSEYILNELPSFFDVLEKNISIIKQNPALSMRAIKKETSIIKSNKPKDLLARKLQPNKKRTFTYDKSYDEYSTENKWLGYIIFEVLPKLLDEFLPNNEQYQKDNSFEQDDCKQDGDLTKVIDTLKQRLDKIKDDEFIKKFNLNLKKQPTITTRLIKTRGYQAIIQAYQEIFNNNFLKAFEFYKNVITAYSSGYLDNLSNIYEHWCLVVLYDNLLKIGFKPDDNCRLENIIELQDDNLVMPSGSVFVLRKPFAQYDYDGSSYDNRGDIVIRLYYEPQIDKRNNRGYYTPDIKIDITAPKRVYGIPHFSLILDAKFKDYQKNNSGNNYNYNSFIHRLLDSEQNKFFTIRDKMLFLSDAIGVSMYKYHYDLENKPNMSMILHPNNQNKFLWSGEMKFNKFLIDNDILTENNFDYFKDEIQRVMNWDNVNDYLENCVSHQFGTLTLRPKELGRDIRRLFAIIFYYHMGLTSLCLGCGRELHEEDEFFVNDFDSNTSSMTKSEQLRRQLAGVLGGFKDNNWGNNNPTTAFRAVCKSCATNWRVSFCSNNVYHLHTPSVDNRIIKLGVNDITGYIPIHCNDEGTHCPKCGNVRENQPNQHIPNISVYDMIDDDRPF